MTLAFLIDRRESWGRRIIKVVGVTMVLFLPDSFRPNVSYMAHFVGLILGVFSALLLYAINYRQYEAAEVTEEVIETDEFDDDSDDLFHT